MRRIFCTAVVFALFCSVRFLPEANAIEHTYNWTAGVGGNYAFVKKGFEKEVSASGWKPTTTVTIPKIHTLRFRECGQNGNSLGFACKAVIKVKSRCDEAEEFKAWYSSSKEFGEAQYMELGKGLAKKFLERFHNQKSQCR